MASGALPPHQSRLGALERWLEASAAAAQGEADRKLLRAYATWTVLARLRRRSRGEDITAGAAGHARQRFRAAHRFLLWLQEAGTAAGQCTQGEIDTWLSSGARSRYEIREFVVWAVSTGAMTGVVVPPKTWREGPALDEDERWAIARRLLHDDGVEIVDRVAGAFVLLFAQKLITISTLTVDDVIVANGQVSVRFGRDPVEVPDPLGELVLRLCADRSGRTVGSPSTNWLFRGNQPGQPMSPSWIGQRFRRLGLKVNSGRRAALMQLAAELPARVLADMLGIAPGTAVHWVRAAGGDWANYAAERAKMAR